MTDLAKAGPRVLVTGTSSGIGHALVPELLSRGFRVIATMRKLAHREGIFAAERAAFGDALELVELDVTSPEDVQRVAAAVSAGGLEHLVNNAGAAFFGAFEDYTDAEFEQALRTNLLGPAELTRALLPALRESNGSLTFLSSMLGLVGWPSLSAYATGKFGLEGLAESLYYELLPHGVSVYLVEPGGHRTRFAANARFGSRALAAYAQMTANHRELRESFLDPGREGTPPQRVAARIAELLERRPAHLRVRVGSDATFAHLLRVLPQSVQRTVYGRVFKRVFFKLRDEHSASSSAPAMGERS